MQWRDRNTQWFLHRTALCEITGFIYFVVLYTPLLSVAEVDIIISQAIWTCQHMPITNGTTHHWAIQQSPCTTCFCCYYYVDYTRSLITTVHMHYKLTMSLAGMHGLLLLYRQLYRTGRNCIQPPLMSIHSLKQLNSYPFAFQPQHNLPWL